MKNKKTSMAPLHHRILYSKWTLMWDVSLRNLSQWLQTMVDFQPKKSQEGSSGGRHISPHLQTRTPPGIAAHTEISKA
jgi:hypothetical protein